MKIAILGWGSLIWEDPPPFRTWHGDWQSNGPPLKLEFSRVSKSRLGALTLVIDNANGKLCTVNYALSKRTHFVDAVADLRCREGCMWKDIGKMKKVGSASFTTEPEKSISKWAVKKGIDAVIWTALESNFKSECGEDFTEKNAKAYLRSLAPDAKVKAAEYIWRAPAFVKTPLRKAIEIAPWF